MGWGDEIMVTSQARLAQLDDPRRVQILDAHGKPRWHALWDGNPRIARPEERGDFQTITNAPCARPYIESKTDERWTWKNYDCQPGEIYLNESEKQFARHYRPQIVIGPTIKSSASPNKNWGAPRWQQFADLAHRAGFKLVQLGSRQLNHVARIETPDFRRAAAVLANAQAYVGHEGGMHHAAAALGIPAVVIFGGFISPRQTGYTMHRNLYAGGEPCGMRVPCQHCEQAMAAITPQMVLNNLLEIIN